MKTKKSNLKLVSTPEDQEQLTKKIAAAREARQKETDALTLSHDRRRAILNEFLTRRVCPLKELCCAAITVGKLSSTSTRIRCLTILSLSRMAAR
jgi:hypothetical protein